MKKNSYLFNMKIKTVSPLAIIENSEIIGGEMLIKIKKLAIITDTDEGKKIEYSPYITANGLRGLLRRLATRNFVNQAKDNESVETFNDSDIHAMLSGSGVSKQELSYSDKQKIEKKNPILSVFGTGIILGSKLKVANAMPETEIIKNLVRRQSIVKVDDILSNTGFVTLFSKEQISDWEKAVNKNSDDRKKDREKEKLAKELGEDFERTAKKESIRTYGQREYITPNSEFFGSFLLENVTQVELGMFLHTLKSFVEFGRIGASQSSGFGVVDIHIEDDKNLINIDRISDDKYIYNAKIDFNLSDIYKEAYNSYNDFLKTIKKDNIEVISVL